MDVEQPAAGEGHVVKQIELFCTLEEAEAIAEEKRSQVRDKVVRLLQYEVRERREAGEDDVPDGGYNGNLQ